MIPDWTIYGFRLGHRSLWFQDDHTLNHIRKIIEFFLDYLYGAIYNQPGRKNIWP